jgi:hypothetical protein
MRLLENNLTFLFTSNYFYIYFPIANHLLKNVVFLAVLLFDPALRFVRLFDLREPPLLRPPTFKLWTLSFGCSNNVGSSVLETVIGGNNVVGAFTGDDIYILNIKKSREI